MLSFSMKCYTHSQANLWRNKMNNYPNTYNQTINNEQENAPYTPPSVPKHSLALPVIFSAIFYFGGIFLPFPFNLALLIPAAILSAKAFSIRSTFLPILSPLPALILPFFTDSSEKALMVAGAFLCGLAVFICAKLGAGKTTAVIASTCVILVILAIICLPVIHSIYGGLSADDFRELVADAKAAFRSFIDNYFLLLDQTIAELPDSAQKENNLALINTLKEAYADTDGILEAFLFLTPSFVIFLANLISYAIVLVYFYLVREGSGHHTCVKKKNSFLTVSLFGVIIFALGYFSIILGTFIPYATIIGLNFVIIFTPALCVVGARSILDPEARSRNKFLMIAAGVMLLINPIFSLLLLGFMGANTIITSAAINFIKKHTGER